MGVPRTTRELGFGFHGAGYSTYTHTDSGGGGKADSYFWKLYLGIWGRGCQKDPYTWSLVVESSFRAWGFRLQAL